MDLRNRRGQAVSPLLFGVFVALCVILSYCVRVSVAAEDGERPTGEEARDQRVELVISYAREETPKEDAAANISVVHREDIEKIPAHNAAEVLQYVPGVNVFFNTGLGGVASTSIQGSESRQVAVFQDGVRLNLLANPVADLRLIPVEIIERIEVVQGAASSAWGSALGGVINIITREPDPTRPLRAEVTNWFGEFGTFRTAETISGTIDRWGYLASLSHKQSDGFMDDTGYRQDTFYAKLNYAPNLDGRLSLVASYDRGRNEDPLPSQTFFDEIREERFYQRLLFEQSFANGFAFVLEGRHQKTSYGIDDVHSDLRSLYFDYSEETVGLGARVSHSGEKNRVLLGFDGDWGKYDYEDARDAHDEDVGTGNWAVYANDTYKIGNLVLNGGLRLDDNQDFGSEISPSAGAVYHLPWKNALLRAQVARGFFAPPERWLHDSMNGNPDLKPETAINIQAGAEIRPFKPLTASISYFRAKLDNMIVNRPEVPRVYDNIEHVTRRGIEGTLTLTPVPWLVFSGGACYVDARDDETGEVITYVPRTMFTLAATSTWRWMTHSIVGRYLNYVGGDTTMKDQVFVFDYLFRARLPFGGENIRMDAFLAVHDLTNACFQYSYKCPRPGRWVESGLSMGF